MNLDELKEKWYSQEHEIDKGLNLNVFHLSTLQSANSALKKLSYEKIMEVIVGLACLVFTGNFLFENYKDYKILIPAILLHAFFLFQVAANGYQFSILRKIDFSQPVLKSQQQYAILKRLRLQVTFWILLLSPLLWVPFLIVLMKSLTGINPYLILNNTWLFANILFGISFIPLMFWAAKHFSKKWQGYPFLKHVLDSLAGNELKAMNNLLEQLNSFEEDHNKFTNRK